jgi:hypothetical protein
MALLDAPVPTPPNFPSPPVTVCLVLQTLGLASKAQIKTHMGKNMRTKILMIADIPPKTVSPSRGLQQWSPNQCGVAAPSSKHQLTEPGVGRCMTVSWLCKKQRARLGWDTSTNTARHERPPHATASPLLLSHHI